MDERERRGDTDSLRTRSEKEEMKKRSCVFSAVKVSSHLISSASSSRLLRCYPLFHFFWLFGRRSLCLPLLFSRSLCLRLSCPFVTGRTGNLFLRMNSSRRRFLLSCPSLALTAEADGGRSAASCTPFTRVATHHRPVKEIK